jgi:hypothetical protein
MMDREEITVESLFTEMPHEHPSPLATPFSVLMPLQHCQQNNNYIRLWKL